MEFSLSEEIKPQILVLLNSIESNVVCLRGDLGVGKTTLVKNIINVLDPSVACTSPTFGIVNEYRNEKNMLLAYHIDCYRIEDENEALDFGIEEYLEESCWIFIEWAENIEGLLPEIRTEITIIPQEDNTRVVNIQNLHR